MPRKGSLHKPKVSSEVCPSRLSVHAPRIHVLFCVTLERLRCEGNDFLASKENRKLQRAHFSLTHATPLLPARTLSEGEFRVSAGERR